MPDASELLAAYDSQLRASFPDPLAEGWTVELDGPLVRFLGIIRLCPSRARGIRERPRA